MNEWIIRVIDDIKKGSIIQFAATVFIIVVLVGYEVNRNISPLATTAILYWDGGFTDEEIERSRLHGLCDSMESWPMATFSERDPKLKDKCAILKRRHMIRTSTDWKEYQARARLLKEKANGKVLKKLISPAIPRAPTFGGSGGDIGEVGALAQPP